MNVAILIGVSRHAKGTLDLPACKNDVTLMHQLIGQIGRFDEILLVDDPSSSEEVKTQLVEFVSRSRTKKVSEVFFYFSGHGSFHDGEFYYVLPDYSQDRLRQTCLENTELDQLIRSLGPELTIKVVDACNAGVPYVKGPESLQSYLQKSEAAYKRCYFMFASQADGYAYQDEELSAFSKSLVDAIVSHSDGVVRYKDLADRIADDFEKNKRQQPFFVIQANYTEEFCLVTPELRQALVARGDPICEPVRDDEIPAIEPQVLPLAAMLGKASEEYRDEEYAIGIVRAISEVLRNSQVPGWLEDAYELRYFDSKVGTSLPDTTEVGEWLENQGGEWFAKPKYERRWVQSRPQTFGSWYSAGLFGQQDGYYEKVTVGYSLTAKLPLNHVGLEVKPKAPVLDLARLYFLFFASETSIAVVWCSASFRKVNWNEHEPRDVPGWSFEEFALSAQDAVLEFVRSRVDSFMVAAAEHVAARLGVDVDALRRA